MLKVKNGSGPSCIKEIFDYTLNRYNLRNNDFNIPRFNKAFIFSNSLKELARRNSAPLRVPPLNRTLRYDLLENTVCLNLGRPLQTRDPAATNFPLGPI